MKNILWIQDPKNEGDDFIYVNGERIEPPTSSMYTESSKLLSDTLNNKPDKKVKGASIYEVQDGFLLSDTFDNLDSIGRRVSLLYYSNTRDPEIFIERFINDASSLDLQYSNVDTLRELLKKPIINKKIMGIVLIIIGLIIVYYLSK